MTMARAQQPQLTKAMPMSSLRTSALQTQTAAPTVVALWNKVPGMLLRQVQQTFLRMSSTLKKRRSKMNKHKLRKRRKKNRMKSK
eukprot:CAMPEP_0198115838 /NCGR_PEP_ID=MMETSP1442-20131203/7568_1 /TAXON_ID= /ORGANISM="Craspedostauros australis, Strain CCMP3328" /LENGTH=84 /DNA_ID=CAMNT_0043773425 /DNA_START=237 /DNA_END=491 /DNA_ORIENTATION=+